MTLERLLTTRELADVLGVDPHWVLRKVQKREIPCFRLSAKGRGLRYRESEVLAWLEASRVGAVPSQAPDLRAVGG